MPDPLAQFSTRRTPQNVQADPRQVPNSAGGYTFQVSPETRLRRFLTIGTESGTYYATERALTAENAAFVIQQARDNTAALVAETVAVSQAGRAPRNNPALFALAAALAHGDENGRRLAAEALPLVARTGTHLFIFAGYAQNMRGWGRAMRRAVGGWYLREPVSEVVYQSLKYRQRNGWTHRDLLRQAHPKGTGAHRELFSWLCGRDANLADIPLVEAFIRLQAAGNGKEAATVIAANRSVTWEMVPDHLLNTLDVQRALLDGGMPQGALIRQLPRLTRLGVIGPKDMGRTMEVAARIADPVRLVKARVHPVNVLVALRTYASGHGARSDATWNPVPQVTDALDAAFYAAFGAVEASGKRHLLALDVSGSMGDAASGLPVSCREVTAALAMVTAATEPQTIIVGFAAPRPGVYGGKWGGGEPAIKPLNISPRQRLDDVMRTMAQIPMGGTDCSLPMKWAMLNHVPIDHFCVFTDDETWYGDVHPHQALRAYRDRMSIHARQSVVAMTSTGFSIADPSDPLSMDVAGMDASVPKLLADFARGDI